MTIWASLSLRWRLLASYIFLLALALGIIATSLFLFLSRQPEPPSVTYQELLTISNNLSRLTVTPVRPRLNRDNYTELTDDLTQFAADYGVRVLVIEDQLDRVTVRFDTADPAITPSQPIEFLVDQEYTRRFTRGDRRFTGPIQVIFGSFRDPRAENTEWLYVGLQIPMMGNAILMADTRPNRSLQSTLFQFGAALGIPLLQSAITGVLIAVILAAVISNTIARPLQKVAIAAKAVAQGDFDQHIAPEGPPEVRSVAEAFNHMTTDVRNLHESQQDFLANVSHDLKTPLTSIQGYSQAIMDGAAKDPARAAAIIYDEAGRLTRMVTELTDLARLQAGAIEMRRSWIDVGQIVTSIAQRLNIVAERKHISLFTDIQPVAAIAGDGDRLAQVFMNLISNAINYTPDEGKVWVRVTPDRGGVSITVRDTGIGIAQAELARIFERFYQVDKTRGPKRGTGLGLAITREIVQAHGGQVHVTSPGEGLGSTFSVWLPIGRINEDIPHQPLVQKNGHHA